MKEEKSSNSSPVKLIEEIKIFELIIGIEDF